MQNTRFNFKDFGEYTQYIALMGSDNSTAHNALLKNLRRAIREELTDKQRLYMKMYFTDRLKMVDIARITGVNPSTVSRTISRGKRVLKRCLRYCAKELLASGENGGI